MDPSPFCNTGNKHDFRHWRPLSLQVEHQVALSCQNESTAPLESAARELF
jgi:hypothetical protein